VGRHRRGQAVGDAVARSDVGSQRRGQPVDAVGDVRDGQDPPPTARAVDEQRAAGIACPLVPEVVEVRPLPPVAGAAMGVRGLSQDRSGDAVRSGHVEALPAAARARNGASAGE